MKEDSRAEEEGPSPPRSSSLPAGFSFSFSFAATVVSWKKDHAGSSHEKAPSFERSLATARWTASDHGLIVGDEAEEPPSEESESEGGSAAPAMYASATPRGMYFMTSPFAPPVPVPPFSRGMSSLSTYPTSLSAPRSIAADTATS